jgi:hypothetical protein
LNQAVGGLGSNAYINGVSSTTFTVSSVANTNAATYVAYVLAHNAGGFGLTGAENVITCGSYAGNGTADGSYEINLGFEPQFLIVHGTGDWLMADNMRCMNYDGGNLWQLKANTSGAEAGSGDYFRPTATGFKIFSSNPNANASGTNYIYIAIRRGPMKVPTDATKVFLPALGSSSGIYTVTTNFPVDSCWYGNRTNSDKWYDFDRLRGNSYLQQNTTGAEVSSYGAFDSNVNFRFTNYSGDGSGYINYAFRRAPSFFDEVCYTGTGSVRTVTHNLGAVPELMIVKSRTDATADWRVYSAATGNTNYMNLNGTGASAAFSGFWNNTSPTSSVFTVGTHQTVNGSGYNFVAYLFATCPGVSKVGSFVLSGSDQTINCGFTAGARFVLIKDTETAGRSWHVWDTARGIVSGTEPFLDLNNTNAEVTIRDWIDPHSTGFTIKAALSGSEGGTGKTFIFLAIA